MPRQRVAWELAEESAIPSGHAAQFADSPLIGYERDGAGPLLVAGEVVPDTVQSQTHHVDLRRVVQDLGKGAEQSPAGRVGSMRQRVRAYRLGKMLRNVGASSSDDHGVRICAACPIAWPWCAPEVSDQRAEQFLADSGFVHRVGTACVDQLEGVTNSPERRVCERPCVESGAPKDRPVKDEFVVCRQLFQQVERKRCCRIERASRVERVMLIARKKDTDSSGGGFLEPVTGAATHAQADPYSDLVA